MTALMNLSECSFFRLSLLSGYFHRRAFDVSMAMGDSAYEAQSCYSLGEVYTLWKNYPKALEFYTKHLHYAIDLGDRYINNKDGGDCNKMGRNDKDIAKGYVCCFCKKVMYVENETTQASVLVL